MHNSEYEISAYFLVTDILGSFYNAAFVIAVILEVWLLILIIPRDNRIDFDNAAIQVLSNLE